MRKHKFLIAAALVSCCIACVTINVYFPEAEIKDLSRVIEEEIRRQAAQPEPGESGDVEAAPESDQSSRNGLPGPLQTGGSTSNLFDLLLGATPAYAQVVEPEISSPEIRAIIASRASRLEKINDYKRRGFVGETNKALLEARDLGGLSDLKARAELTKLIRDENQDREKLFKEIASAKGVEASQLDRISETYAATLRSQARPGDWIQMPDGSWKQK